MCGIVGSFLKKNNGEFKFDSDRVLKKMHHRGPDGSGSIFIETNTGDLYFGHTRLSILDLSHAGSQPMFSSDKHFLITFNGEIYNYLELRSELINLGHIFISDSDTEVLLTAFSQWGVECVHKLKGMFSFAIFDKNNDRILLFRDAFGIKPMFYFVNENQFGFSSELDPLKEIYGGKLDYNLQIIYDYLVHATYDHTDSTFYKEFNELRPGHIMTINLNDLSSKVSKWWNPKLNIASSIEYKDAVKLLRQKFLENIKLHLRSDVPIGAALSGGIDSSAVVCAIRYLEPNMPLNTFSFIADGKKYNENKWVDIVNDHVGAIPNKIFISEDDMVNDISDLIKTQGQPFGSTSIYAEYKLYKSIKEKNISVVLNGQGADELLAGYDGYFGYSMLSMLENKKYLDSIKFFNSWVYNGNRSYIQGIMEFGQNVLPNKMYSIFRAFLGRNFTPRELNIDLFKEQNVKFEEFRDKRLSMYFGRRVIERLQNSINRRGLPALLRHGDRNSMRWSVEGRVPFLTSDFAEFLLSLPENFLISRKGVTKNIFRDAMSGIVPDVILNRKDKIGFETPTDDWLKKYLSLELPRIEEAIQGFNFLNKDNYMNILREYENGRKKIDWKTWRMINLAMWLKFQN
jgi:asparagine synthase (glutamine-hydrolysing)